NIDDYDPEAEIFFDEVAEAFYKGEFPYVSILVEKAGWSLDELVALEPPAYQEVAPSPPVSLV
ncbi:hypothetical protein Tco_1342304, partial [Tanacetum coccineum]